MYVTLVILQSSPAAAEASHQRNMDRLEQSRRQLAETEALAIDTTSSLHAQRNQIENVQKNVRPASSDGIFVYVRAVSSKRG